MIGPAVSSSVPVDPPPIDAWIDRFRVNVRQEKGRIGYERIVEIFQVTMPAHALTVHAPAMLAEALHFLRKEGSVTLPRRSTPGAWINDWSTPLPRSLRVVPRAVRRDSPKAEVVWHPKLDDFVASDPRSRILAHGLKVNEWLRTASPGAPVVPYRERSMEIFGDEETMEKTAFDRDTGILFEAGPVTFADLACYVPASPLPYVDRPGAPGRPHLVVANLHTWETMRNWNEKSGVYASVLWGSGNAAPAAAGFVVNRADGSAIHYLCDIAPGPFSVMGNFAARVARYNGGSVIFPTWAAVLMLRKAGSVDMPIPENTDTLMGEMSDDLKAAVASIVASSPRIPTEIIQIRDLDACKSFPIAGNAV